MKRVCKRPVMLDALTVCFQIEDNVLYEKITSVSYGEEMDFLEFRIRRTEGEYYKNVYSIIYDDCDTEVEFGLLKFNLNDGVEADNIHFNGKQKAWISLNNKCLYTEALSYLGFIVQRLRLEFNNYTTIDLCLDTPFEISRILKTYIKDKDNTVILNGKTIRDRDEDRPEIKYDTSGSLNKTDKYLTVTIKQKKAIKNKHNGVTVTTYNKVAEVKNSSHKQYILDYYGNPKKLFRTEVHLNNEEIKDFMKTRGLVLNPYMLDGGILEEMFFYHLNSVVRFKKREKEYYLGRTVRP